MKVKKWIKDDKKAEKYKESVGWLGGFFGVGEDGKPVKDMRWKDYLEHFKPETYPYLEAIRESVVENNIRFGGDYHQSPGYNGVPLFEDNTTLGETYLPLSGQKKKIKTIRI